MDRPLILISNDDGVNAPGIKYLIEAVADMGHVIVVAPSGAQSAKSSALTFDAPLRIVPQPSVAGAEVYAVTGTPVDCVKLGLHAIVPRKPDLMLCGVNHGSNAAISVVNSGTMGAVMEACLKGIPAIGFSLLDHHMDADFSHCGKLIREIGGAVLSKGLPDDICLNVNIPKGQPQGIKVVRAAHGCWNEEYVKYTDPFGQPFYMVAGEYINYEPDADDTDEYWLQRGYATIVPTSPDFSRPSSIPAIRNILSL